MSGAATRKRLRIGGLVLAAAALATAGCLLVSGQFVVTYALPDPLTVAGSASTAIAGVDVDLNTIGDYNDHKDDLKRVEDLALIGDFKNNNSGAVGVEAWIVPSGTLNLKPQDFTANGGTLLWGPLNVAGNATEHVDWNRSAGLFKGRQALIDEIKGDGRFALYVVASGTFNLTLNNGAIIAVIGAAK